MNELKDFVITRKGILKEYKGEDINVIIPDSVKRIEANAFYKKEIESVLIPEGVVSIGSMAFNGCEKLTEIVLPNTVTSIEEYAFAHCINLMHVTMSSRVVNVGKNIFFNCNSLVYNEYGNGYYVGDDQNPYYMFVKPKEKRLDTCEFSQAMKVIAGEKTLFSDNWQLNTMVLPYGLISIGDGAFESCEELAEVVIPEGVISIGQAAFYGCKSLTRITVPDSVASIGKDSFAYCECLVSVKMGEKLTVIANGAFSHCLSLRSIVLPAGVTDIGTEAFGYCKELSEIKWSKNLINIGYSAFWGCAFTSIIIPQGVKTVGYKAFEGCVSLKKLVIPKSVEKIKGAIIYCPMLDDIEISIDESSIQMIERINSDEFNSTDLIIYALDGSVVMLRPKYQMCALKGFADAYFKKMEWVHKSKEMHEEIVKKNTKKVQQIALQDEEVLRLILLEKWFNKKDIEMYLNNIENIELRAILLECVEH